MTPDMERALRTAGRKTREWTAERDRLICAAVAEGEALRAVATAVKLSPQGVKLIADRGIESAALQDTKVRSAIQSAKAGDRTRLRRRANGR